MKFLQKISIQGGNFFQHLKKKAYQLNYADNNTLDFDLYGINRMCGSYRLRKSIQQTLVSLGREMTGSDGDYT